MKHRFLILISVLVLNIMPLHAEENTDWLKADGMALIPWASIGLQFGIQGLYSLDGEITETERRIASSTLELGNIGLFLSDPDNALDFTLGSLGLFGLETVCANEFGSDTDIVSSAYWTRIDHNMYKSYRSYGLTRLESEEYNNSNFKVYKLGELYKAPFDIEVLKDPIVWGGILGEIAFASALDLMFADETNYGTAVWDTNAWYVKEISSTIPYFIMYNGAFNLWNAVTTAVGEESIFRGVLYEELKYHFGVWPARITDIVAFTGLHIVTDIVREQSAQFIIMHGIEVALSTLLYDIQYDRGGLPYTVAQHSWFDVFEFCKYSLTSGGVPLSER